MAQGEDPGVRLREPVDRELARRRARPIELVHRVGRRVLHDLTEHLPISGRYTRRIEVAHVPLVGIVDASGAEQVFYHSEILAFPYQGHSGERPLLPFRIFAFSREGEEVLPANLPERSGKFREARSR